jgi:hypothetical protein
MGYFARWNFSPVELRHSDTCLSGLFRKPVPNPSKLLLPFIGHWHCSVFSPKRRNNASRDFLLAHCLICRRRCLASRGHYIGDCAASKQPPYSARNHRVFGSENGSINYFLLYAIATGAYIQSFKPSADCISRRYSSCLLVGLNVERESFRLAA